MKINLYTLLLLVLFSCCKVKEAPLDMPNVQKTDYNKLSEDFLKALQADEPTDAIEAELANTTIEALDKALRNDAQRYAFWVNIYNAYIQAILNENPELYDDRREFFKKEQIKIAGENVSFAKIEHGILRKSQWELGLGYIRKWFPGKFERKLRVDERDFRIHFALNCGAKDCPPVAIYTPKRVDEQFEKGTKKYLERTTEYDAANKVAKVTSLFNWFRGDFGGKSGVRKILKSYDITPETKGVELQYKNYDWTLDLDNYIDL